MRVLTYNVHSCRDINGINTIGEIQELIKKVKPAVVALNEIEAYSPRTWFANQPRKLADARDMAYYYGPTLKIGIMGLFGNAILSRYPICEKANYRLPGDREPRCCIRTVLRIPAGYISVYCTHLSLKLDEQTMQISELANIIKKEKHPMVMMGDFNCNADQLVTLFDKLRDAGELFGSKPTYPFDKPKYRIDYILLSSEIQCLHMHIPKSAASDHLPVMADLDIK